LLSSVSLEANLKSRRREMKRHAVVTGICGLLLCAVPALADPSVASAEKAYRLLQTISAQLQEAQKSLGLHSPAPTAAALATAEAQVRVAFAHSCRALYTAHLEAAKAALVQHEQQKALHHLLKANETLGQCAGHPVTAEPHDGPETPVFESSLARR
jgi:hypothetical protein